MHHSNMDVFVVLHSPVFTTDEKGKEVRSVTTDVWRVVSEAKSGWLHHNKALDMIADHYLEKLPHLKRVSLWTDGCRGKPCYDGCDGCDGCDG